MNAKFDTERIVLSDGYIKAIEKLIQEELLMMQEQHDAECWTWGKCVISDLSKINNLSFSYGGDDYRPDELPEGKTTLITFEGEL